MIELFDASRLTVKHDRTLALAVAVLALAGGAMAAHTGFLHVQLKNTQARTQELQERLAALDGNGRAPTGKAAASPRAALVADLQRQTERMEQAATNTGLAAGSPSNEGPERGPRPSQWMDLLVSLARVDTSLQKVDIERSGGTRFEGLAASPQALNALVQAWEQQDSMTHLQTRSIEVKQEKLPAPFLRFLWRATPVPAAAAAAAASASAAGAPATKARPGKAPEVTP